jgi:serine/threonine protein kinase
MMMSCQLTRSDPYCQMHLDLAPRNVLLTSPAGRVCLTDLGIALPEHPWAAPGQDGQWLKQYSATVAPEVG